MATTNDEALIKAASAKQAKKPLESKANEVEVSYANQTYLLKFPFSAAMIKVVKGNLKESAQWDKEAKGWAVPVAKYEEVKATADKLRELTKSMEVAHDEIFEASKAATPNAKVSIAFTKDNTRTTGAVLAMNDHYIAQSNGSKDGVNYVAVHERAALGQTKDIRFEEVSIGKPISIFYMKGTGTMWTPKPAQEQEAKPAQAQKQEAKPAPAKAPSKGRQRQAAPQAAGPAA